MDEAFDMYCQGFSTYGPFWDGILGYWNAHLQNPGKVLFLKYEDLKEDITFQVKKIAEFIGFPFSLEEEEQGLIDQISGLCSFESLSNLAVNKTGDLNGIAKNSSFFRKGQVGDWINYLTPAMVERIKKLMDLKFEGSGLMFKTGNKKG
ncbi:UNVERIFIED_CONTAM: Flavonol 4'-sulfotransferase [Sesamum radiatum]|uniref:Sulfotransferase n=1 Tax=Sesamum radiatum TaxID=300843 RepID=A0AAW2JV45_SESRA